MVWSYTVRWRAEAAPEYLNDWYQRPDRIMWSHSADALAGEIQSLPTEYEATIWHRNRTHTVYSTCWNLFVAIEQHGEPWSPAGGLYTYAKDGSPNDQRGFGELYTYIHIEPDDVTGYVASWLALADAWAKQVKQIIVNENTINLTPGVPDVTHYREPHELTYNYRWFSGWDGNLVTAHLRPLPGSNEGNTGFDSASP